MCKVLFALLLASSILWAKESTTTNEAVTVNINGSMVINNISNLFFGHNYWTWCPTWGSSTSGTDSIISELNVKLLRFGGINNDVESPDKITDKVLKDFGRYCDSIKAEPLLQLNIAECSTIEARVSNAVAMFTAFKKIRPVKYVSIGNEPDIYAENLAINEDYNVGYLSTYTVDDYCKDFNAIAVEIKKIDPEVKIVGLELSHKRTEWIPSFVAKCKDNIDIISLHYYPFSAAQCNYSTVHNQSTSMNYFYSQMRSLIDSNAGGKQIPLIIGETNITWDGDPVNSTRTASPGTFYAALWIADFTGVSSAQKNVISVMPWSICEGWTLGFLDLKLKPKPVYYVYKMMSDNIKSQMIHNENVNQYVRVYGYKDSMNNVSLFTVNWDTVTTYNTTFNFSGILSDTSYQWAIPPQSFACLTFSSDFKNKQIILYTKGASEPVGTQHFSSAVSNRKGTSTIKLDAKHSLLKISTQHPLNDASIIMYDIQGKVLNNLKVGNLRSGSTTFSLAPLRASSIHLLRLTSGSETVLEVNAFIDR